MLGHRGVCISPAERERALQRGEELEVAGNPRCLQVDRVSRGHVKDHMRGLQGTAPVLTQGREQCPSPRWVPSQGTSGDPSP